MDKANIQTSKYKEGQKKLLILIIRSLWIISFLLGVASSLSREEDFRKTELTANVNNNQNNSVNNNEIEDTSVNNVTQPLDYENLSGKVIVVDAGHGGADPGTQGDSTGVLECDINMEIANMLSEKLTQNGVSVVMTRTDSNTEELGKDKKFTFKQRKVIIQNANADMLISIHQNYYEGDSTIRGGQVLIRRKEDCALAELLQESLNKELTSSRNYIQGKYEILKYVDQPGFIIECGFLSNKEEERLLQTQDYQEKIVQLLLENLNTYWNHD